MATAPVPVCVLGSDCNKKGVVKRTKNSSTPYKFINRIDGEGMYARFAFFAKTLDEANNILSSMYSNKIFDNIFSHAYTRTGQRQGFSIHGVAHCVRKDYDFFYLRKNFPQAFVRCSFYPDGPQQKKQSTEVLQEGVVPGNVFANPNCCTTYNGQSCNETSLLTFSEQ